MDIKREPPKKTRQYIVTGIVVLGIVAVSVGVARLKPAAPTVEGNTLWTDSVRRGDMVRAVTAAGTLVPEHIRIITSPTAGRIEVMPIRPGAQVGPTTTIIELSNPDESMQVLQYDNSLSAAKSAAVSLRNSLTQQEMSQRSTIAAMEAQYRDAVRQATVADSLEKRGGLMSANEVAAARDRVTQLRTQLEIEQARLAEMRRTAADQLRLNDDQVRMLTAITAAQRQRATAMRVVAGEPGVLQTLNNLELGQWVQQGQELARVAQPGRLKAVLRVPESQAKDVAVGQAVKVDLHNNQIVRGRVIRADPSAQAGTVTVEVAIEDAIPAGVRADQSIDGTIEIENLRNVLHVNRPVYGQAEQTVGLFRLECAPTAPRESCTEAVRVQVKLGRASVSVVEVQNGLVAGDRIIISDMAQHDSQDRVRIKW